MLWHVVDVMPYPTYWYGDQTGADHRWKFSPACFRLQLVVNLAARGFAHPRVNNDTQKGLDPIEEWLRAFSDKHKPINHPFMWIVLGNAMQQVSHIPGLHLLDDKAALYTAMSRARTRQLCLHNFQSQMRLWEDFHYAFQDNSECYTQLEPEPFCGHF